MRTETPTTLPKMENHVAKQLRDVFGHCDLYKVFGLESSADEQNINKSYKILALKYHPDRKGGDTVKFQAISAAHSILSNTEKKKLYDETGNLESEDTGDDFDFWKSYFNTLFPKVTAASIEEFSSQYRGSDEEREDVIRVYLRFEGDFTKMMECIMCAEEGDEERIFKLVDCAIAASTVQEYSKYSTSKAVFLTKRNSEASVRRKRERKKLIASDNTSEDLASLILANRSSRASAFSAIFNKYGDENDMGAISDAAFAKSQSKLLRKAPKKNPVL